jgi:hypothetical protein
VPAVLQKISLLATILALFISGLATLAAMPERSSPSVPLTTGGSLTVQPNTAGRKAQYVFEFFLDANGAGLPAHIGEVEFLFDKDTQIPSSIPAGAVLFRADLLTNPLGQGGVGTGGADQMVPAELDPVIDSAVEDSRRQKITIKVPDMDPTSGGTPGEVGVGPQGIAPGALVTVTFTIGAGISNPTEREYSRIDITARPSAAGAQQIAGSGSTALRVTAPIRNQIFTSDIQGSRGYQVTITGVGFNNDTTATVWLDNGVDLDRDEDIDTTQLAEVNETVAGLDLNGDGDHDDIVNGGDGVNFSELSLGFDMNGDGDANDTNLETIQESDFRRNGKRDSGEQDLATALVQRDDTFEVTITVSNPPFKSNQPNINERFNVINAIDDRQRIANPGVDDATYELEPSVAVAPGEAAVGDTVTLTLKDWDHGPNAVSKVTIAGIEADLPPMLERTFDSDGAASFSVKVPHKVIRTGLQKLEVEASFTDSNGTLQKQSEYTTLSIKGPQITTSQTEIIANQELTIWGSGFTESIGNTTICVMESSLTLANVPLEIDNASADASCRSGDDEGVEVAGSGTFIATVMVREANQSGDAGLDNALLTSGPRELKVIDTGGTEGTANITMQDRKLHIFPEPAGPQDTIEIIGEGYPADNLDASSPEVIIKYDCGSGCEKSVITHPDFAGKFRITMRIPSDVSIPSTNAVNATIPSTGTTDIVTHEVPAPMIIIDPPHAQPGGLVRIFGQGFRRSETVDDITIGNQEVLTGRAINTDEDGNLVAEGILVPSLDPGLHAVQVTVGEGKDKVTAGATIKVIEDGISGDQATPAVDAIAGLGDGLVRVFHFDNAKKVWTFFDSREEFADNNTLDEFVPGQTYWMRVMGDADAELNSAPLSLNCVNAEAYGQDCWNLIVWP